MKFCVKHRFTWCAVLRLLPPKYSKKHTTFFSLAKYICFLTAQIMDIIRTYFFDISDLGCAPGVPGLREQIERSFFSNPMQFLSTAPKCADSQDRLVSLFFQLSPVAFLDRTIGLGSPKPSPRTKLKRGNSEKWYHFFF